MMRHPASLMLALVLTACRTVTEPCEVTSFMFDGSLSVNGVSGAGQYQGGTSPLSIGIPAYAAMDSTLFTDAPGATAIRLASLTLLGPEVNGILTIAFGAPMTAGRTYGVDGLTREIDTAPHVLRAGREAEAGLSVRGVVPDSVQGTIGVSRRDPLVLDLALTFHFADAPISHIMGPVHVIRREGPLRCP